MKVILSVTLSENDTEWAPHSETLFKTAEWDAIPSGDATIQFGVSEEGETGSVSTYDPRIYWDTSGVVNIGLRSLNLREEYDAIRECALRDGFLPYKEWKEQNGT